MKSEIKLESGSCVPDFCEKFAGKARGALIPYAADVVVISRMSSIRLCVDYFSEKLGRKISRRPVVDIIDKVRRGEIRVTREELVAAANSHPVSAKYLAKCPWLAEPKLSKEAESPPGVRAKSSEAKSTKASKLPIPKKSSDKSKAAVSPKEQPPNFNHEDELQRLREIGRAHRRNFDEEPLNADPVIAELQEATRPK